MTTTRQNRDYQVGLFTFVGIVVLGVLILLYGEEPTWILTTRYDLKVLVDQPTGIGEGTPAFMQGVLVGRVSEIKFQDPQLPSKGAAVIVGIDDEYDIPQRSTATIHPSFGFDKGAINIHPPEVATKPLDHKDSYIVGEMKGALESIVPEEYIRNLGAAVEQISNMADQIGQMAGKIAVVSEDLHQILQVRTKETVDDPDSEIPANLYTAIQRGDELIKLVNNMIGEEGDFRATVADLRYAAADFRAWTAKLEGRTEQVVSRADATLESMQQRIDDVGAKALGMLGDMSSVLDQVQIAMSAVNQGDGALGKLIHDQKLYEELVDSLDELQLLIGDLRTLSVWVSTESRIAP